MVIAKVVLDKDGVLRSCKASGHAGAGKTESVIVCAAVSVLVETAVNTLSGREGITIRCQAPKPGIHNLDARYTAEGKVFLFAVGEFLISGFEFIAREFPENCKLTVRRL